MLLWERKPKDTKTGRPFRSCILTEIWLEEATFCRKCTRTNLFRVCWSKRILSDALLPLLVLLHTAAWWNSYSNEAFRVNSIKVWEWGSCSRIFPLLSLWTKWFSSIDCALGGCYCEQSWPDLWSWTRSPRSQPHSSTSAPRIALIACFCLALRGAAVLGSRHRCWR